MKIDESSEHGVEGRSIMGLFNRLVMATPPFEMASATHTLDQAIEYCMPQLPQKHQG